MLHNFMLKVYFDQWRRHRSSELHITLLASLLVYLALAKPIVWSW